MGITPMAATDNNQLQRSTNNFTLDDVNAHDFNDVDDGGGGERGTGEKMTEQSPSQQDITLDSLGSLVCVRDEHIGILRYFGHIHFKEGLWCGVELAEPEGKNDGSVKGYRYFSCEDKYGLLAPLSYVRKVKNKPLAASAAASLLQTSEITSGISSGAAGHTNTKLPVDLKNRPAALPMPIQQLQCSNNKLPMYYQKESARHTVAPPVAPATTPVTEEIKYITSTAAAVVAAAASSAPLLRNARAKNESKRGKDSHHRVNPQQKKKRKLDSSQKQVWNDDDDDDDSEAVSTGSTSSGNNINVTTKSNPTSQLSTPESSASSRMPQSIDLPNFMNVKLKEEILGAGFLNSPLFSPTPSYKDGFASRLVSSTPANHGYRGAMSRLERLRLDKNSPSQGTPKSSRLGENFGEQKRSAPRDFPDESSPSRNPNFRVGYSDKEWVQSALQPRHHSVTTTFDLERNPLPEENIFDTLPTPLSNLQAEESFFEKSLGELDEESTDGALASPLSSTTKEDTTSDDINFEGFPAKRPSSISLAFQGFSSEESSEQGIFGVSTPELIGGDSASLALSIPTSCCSSPDVLIENDNDNESSLGLLTPSHLQDCWNSNTNDEDIYQHLRSPSVDDMEEFEEEDKTVDQDLSDVTGLTTAPPLNPFRGRMASSVHGTLVLNENDGLTTIPHNLYQPMHHSLHEGILHLGQGRVRRDRTYTQLPVVPNLNRQLSEPQQPNQIQPIESSQHQQQQTNQHGNHHPPLSFRGSGSGSGYCASDPFTDSDFNTESEADHDHDECSSSAATNPPTSTSASGGCGTHVNSSTTLKNRNARVIDGALYTSHHHHHQNGGNNSAADRVSPNLHQQQHHSQQPMSMSHHTYMHPSNRPENTYSTTSSVTDSAVSVGKSMDMISSSISVSVSSNSASACASEMESSGFYSDASERNPSGGSVMSESDHVYGGQHHHNHGHRRSSRHLSKSSSDCDDSSVALSMGMKMVPLKPLTQSEDDDSVQILDASSMCNDDDDDEVEECIDDMSSLEMTGSLNETMLAVTCNEGKDGRTVKQITPTKLLTGNTEYVPSQKSVSNGKANHPNVGEYQSQSQSNKDQQVPNIDDFMQYDEEDMDVDLFAEYEEGKANIGKELNLGASQLETHSVVAMDLALSKSPSGISPLCSPMNALHGNLFETGGVIPSGFLSGGGNCGGVACYRSQSVNCIASLTSSTSSASTVTTKSCVTAGAASGVPATSKSTRGGKKGGNSGGGGSSTSSTSSSKSKVQSIEGKSSKHGTVSATVTGNNAKKTGSTTATGRSTVENVTSSCTESSSGRTGGTSTSTNINNNNDTVTAASSGSVRGNVPPAAEQSSVVSTTTGGSSNSANATSNRSRSSRMNATGGKSSSSAGGPRKNGSSTGTGGGSASSRANTSSISTISSSSDLNKSNRSIAAKGSVHGSNRSLASVGLAPASNSNTSTRSSISSPQAKKLNKWDAVMSKIAENQHKQINVKDVKSKVFNSSVLKAGGTDGGGGVSGPASAGSNSSAGAGSGGGVAGKTSKSGKTASRVTLVDRSNENDPLVPSAVHRRQHHFSSRSSTVSDSSLDDHQPHRGPPPAKHHRAKKDASINRRQVSDLSSASDYSAKAQSQTNSATNNKNNTNNPKSMTTGGTRRVQRGGGGGGGVTANNTTSSTTTTVPHGTKSTNSTSNTGGGNASSSTKSQGTKGSSSQASEIAKKKGVSSNLTSTTRGGTSKAKVGSFTVSSAHQNDNPSTKSHPAVKPLRDRNRLGPVGKNYGSSALDANANESEGPLLRGQANGELDHHPSAKSCTKVAGSAEPLIADPSTNNHVISKNKSAVAHNNRVSSHNQHNTQNSVLVQENSSLKEEVSRLTSIVSDLQEQISRLATSGEETKKTLEGCLKDADKRCVALGIVAQQLDKQRLGEYEQLVQQQAENKEWKHQLDEKLAELQKLQSEYEKEREQNQEEMRALTKRHELEVDITVKNCEDKLEQIEQRHNLTLAELKRSHQAELEKLQENHQKQLEELQLQQQQAIEEFQDEHPETRMLKEIDSLRAIVDMKLERIKHLEKQVVDHEQLMRDFQISKDSEARLIAKIEDIDAQLQKARQDRRETIAKCLKLEEDLKQTQLDNEKLLRSKEELEWKLKPFENEQNKNK